MNIYMVTNVFRPKVGGVTRSIELYANTFRERGHQVKIIAPSFPDYEENEPDVIRVPAFHNVLADYSLPVPYPGLLTDAIEELRPDVVHAHHPFLLGATGHRIATTVGAPIVYTHHSRFDAYGNYFPTEHGFLQNFVVNLSVQFANICQAVIAPGTFVRDMLREAGVDAPIHVIPTGVEIERFATGDRRGLRQRLKIDEQSPVVGHVGRLSDEKNLKFLARSVAKLLRRREEMHFVVAGDGPAREDLETLFAEAGVADQVHLLGMLEGQKLVDVYHALDVFAFSSHSETQGMVLTEAMAAGAPVVALHASGVDDVLQDGRNGRLLMKENEDTFAAALEETLDASPERKAQLREGALATAREFSLDRCARRMLELYASLAAEQPLTPNPLADPQGGWNAISLRLKEEIALLATVSQAAQQTLAEWGTD